MVSWATGAGPHCAGLRLSSDDSLHAGLPLEAHWTPGLLNPEQVSAFGNIESIYALNRYGGSLTHPMFLL